eukprot:15407339-Alexandrium_andersonii.AAC.1
MANFSADPRTQQARSASPSRSMVARYPASGSVIAVSRPSKVPDRGCSREQRRPSTVRFREAVAAAERAEG